MEFEDEVKEMIDCHQEGDYLDFKEYDYNKENKEELVKDVLAFANSHSIRNKYIIIGAIEENNICTGLRGIDKNKIRDDAEFQQIINSYIYEDLVVNYKVVNVDGKDILVIQIPVENNANRPFMIKKQIGKLKENEIYIRKSSSTALATKKDLEYMFKKNKTSKLILQSYLDGELSNKIQLSNINIEIDKYRQKKLEKLKQFVNDINNLKGNTFLFKSGESIFIKKEVVKIEEEKEKFIKESLNDLKIDYDNSIFEFKNVKWKTTFNGGGLNPVCNTLYGDKKEIERYWKLEDLESYIIEYLAINYYFNELPNVYSTNLVLSNIGNYFDEDIELKLIIDKEIFFDKEALIVDDSTIKYLGNMYNDLREEIIECPRTSSIDEYHYPFATPVLNNPSQHISPYMDYMYNHEPTYLDKAKDNADDFKDYLEYIFDDSIYEENDKIVIKIDFKKIMQNKSMFLEAKLLFKSDKVKIDFEIRSKNNSETIYGFLENQDRIIKFFL